MNTTCIDCKYYLHLGKRDLSGVCQRNLWNFTSKSIQPQEMSCNKLKLKEHDTDI